MVFNAFKENCPRDRKIVNFDNVCKLQRGNVIDDCCLLWKSFEINVWLYFASEIVSRSDENSLYCTVLIDVISECFVNVISIAWNMKRLIGLN